MQHITSHPKSTSDVTGDVNEYARWNQRQKNETKQDQQIKNEQQVKKVRHK